MGKLTIGLDIGGTKIDGIVWDGKNIVRQLTIATPKTLFEFGHNLSKLITFLRAKDKIITLGVSMAGLADKKKKILVSSPNIKYIQKFSFEKFGRSLGFKKISLENDANSFLLAETVLGQAKNKKHVLGIILGTGLGGAMFLNGRLYRGSENFGGEVGKMSVGTALTWEQEYQKFRDKKDWDNLSRILVKGFFSLVKIFNPEQIILAGSVAENIPSQYLKKIRKELEQKLLEKQTMPQIVVSTIKNVGAIGSVLQK